MCARMTTFSARTPLERVRMVSCASQLGEHLTLIFKATPPCFLLGHSPTDPQNAAGREHPGSPAISARESPATDKRLRRVAAHTRCSKISYVFFRREKVELGPVLLTTAEDSVCGHGTAVNPMDFSGERAQ